MIGIILGASCRRDTFTDGEGKSKTLASITPGEVWRVLTSDGKVGHWHMSHLRGMPGVK
jgi:hypothetical protein